MGILDPGPERAMQLYFHDEPKVTFRRLELDGAAMIVRNRTNKEALEMAFLHYYQTIFPFNGYKNISAGGVTLGFSRDIVLDPFPILSEELRPPKRGGLNCPFITKIGAFKRYKLATTKPPASVWDKMTTLGLVVAGTLAFAILLKVGLSYWQKGV